MIYGENQNRQFYVVTKTGTGDSATVNAEAKISNGKFYVKLTDEGVSTDKITNGMIRDIRISKPTGPALKQWTITMPTTVVVDEDYFINMEFRNWMGFGANDIYLKFAVAHATTANRADLATKFAANLNKAFAREAIKPFASIVASGNTVVIKEREEDITKTSILRGITRLPVEVKFGLDTTDENEWADSNVAVTSYKTLKNAEVIADMEYFFMKGRADMYGYMGFPNINPTEMQVDPKSDVDYYVLDIKYFFQEHGMLNQNSEKEMTFVCIDKATLEGLITDIVVSTTGTTLSGGRDVEIYAPKNF